ncbi:hypothetical protein FHT76_000788 [Rhizobium sp. BK176]|nr:hypothetical protein [Rhizobium sp. BK176]
MRKAHGRWRIDQILATIGSLFRWRKSVGLSPQESPVAVGSSSFIVDDESITAWFQAHNSCPDCGGARFVDGPKGGMSRNIRCENAACGSQYNVAAVQGHVLFAQRIHWEHSGKRTIH